MVELAEIAALTAEMAATHHVGRRNRLLTQRGRLLDAIDRQPERLASLRALLDHSQPTVRMAAAWHCGWRQVVADEAERAVAELAQRDDEIGREARRWLENRPRMAAGNRWEPPPPKTLSYDPAPIGCSNAAATELIVRSVSKQRVRALFPLLVRVTRIWPRAHTGDPRTSCFGGLPALPAAYAWPTFEDEPLLFLGQINCAEVHAAVGPHPVPECGLLQFYGDHDEVNGCGPSGASAVLYFPDPDALEPAPPPIEDFVELPRCGLEFYETLELPDPLSEVIANLRFSAAEQKQYRELRGKMTPVGVPGPADGRASKLLGWPDLIQRDLGADCGVPRAGSALLLQIGWYHDGAEWQSWGPGGLIYFILDQEAIVEARFSLAAMEMQCT